jgi:tRNA(Arg) A34 adenosine deaminase TadA
MCLAAVYWARIPRVVFAGGAPDATEAGFDDARIAQEMTLSWGERSIVARRALEEEGREILLEWARNPHRILY